MRNLPHTATKSKCKCARQGMHFALCLYSAYHRGVSEPQPRGLKAENNRQQTTDTEADKPGTETIR